MTRAEAAAAERYARLVGKGWIAVDLDGTLAHYDHFVSILTIGAPIMPMVERVKKWLTDGHEVKILTARVSLATVAEDFTSGETLPMSRVHDAISDWCEEHIGTRLEVTCVKDWRMIELWDDRAIQVIPNTGRTLSEEHAAELSALRGAP